jgi:hypothetical protein
MTMSGGLTAEPLGPGNSFLATDKTDKPCYDSKGWTLKGFRPGHPKPSQALKITGQFLRDLKPELSCAPDRHRTSTFPRV